MKILYFVFFKLISQVEITNSLRVSVWLEDSNYLMPAEFIEVGAENNFYFLKIRVLDPDNFVENAMLEKKISFWASRQNYRRRNFERD